VKIYEKKPGNISDFRGKQKAFLRSSIGETLPNLENIFLDDSRHCLSGAGVLGRPAGRAAKTPPLAAKRRKTAWKDTSW